MRHTVLRPKKFTKGRPLRLTVYPTKMFDIRLEEELASIYDKVCDLDSISENDFGSTDKFDENMIPLRLVDLPNSALTTGKMSLGISKLGLHESVYDDSEFLEQIRGYYDIPGSFHILRYIFNDEERRNSSEILYIPETPYKLTINDPLVNLNGQTIFNMQSSCIYQFRNDPDLKYRYCEHSEIGGADIRKKDFDQTEVDDKLYLPRLVYRNTPFTREELLNGVGDK